MKNINLKLIGLCFLVLSLCGGWKCKKKETPAPNNPAPTAATSSWKVGSAPYSSSTAARSTTTGNALSIIDGTNNSGIAIYFSAFPSASGTYKVAKYSTSGNPSSTLASDQISVDATINGGSDDYLTTGSGNVSATVTVTSGKISVTLPAAWGQHFNSGGPQTDSLQISGTISEK